MLPCKKDLLHLGNMLRLFFIRQIPDGHLILHGLVDAQEKIDDTLSIRVTKVVCQVTLDARDKLRGYGQDAFLTAKLGMMRY